MSTHTVYGCYIASTGKFEFSDTVCTEATITGCLVKEGDHAGQIEITHDYGGCETQYYACYDPATGKFEFEADDGCCEEEPEYVESGCCGGPYPGCEVAPRYYQVALSGLTSCNTFDPSGSGCCCGDRNGTYITELSYDDPPYCTWSYSASCGNVVLNVYLQMALYNWFVLVLIAGHACFNGGLPWFSGGAPPCYKCDRVQDEVGNASGCGGSVTCHNGNTGTATVSLV